MALGSHMLFCVSADKSLNFRVKHFTPIPNEANDSEKTVMNSSMEQQRFAALCQPYYTGSKAAECKTFHFERNEGLTCCRALHSLLSTHSSHLMVHRVVMKLWFVIFLQCCKTCRRILTAPRSVALGLDFVAEKKELRIPKGTKNWLDFLKK